MAKPDWGAIQKQFLADHAITNISPKDWCEAQGINYATARRYVKKPSVTDAQKTAQPAQKKMRNVRSDAVVSCINELIDGDGFTPMQAAFVIEYLKDKNASQAALRAGYSDSSTGPQLIRKDHIAQAINRQLRAIAERQLITADQIVARMWDMATVDVNELVEYRRYCCRYCWGKLHGYQWTEEEYGRARDQALIDKKPEPDVAGGFGFREKRPPHPECPQCNGDGTGAVHIHDSRRLSPAARMAYDGVKVTKDGVQVLIADRGRMLENVAKHLGLFDSPAAKQLQELDIEARRIENQRARQDEKNEGTEPTPVQIIINAVDARVPDGDQSDA